MAKLLFITYNFPPINSAGVFRVVGMIPHLVTAGWSVHVVTVRGSSVEAVDARLLDLVPPAVEVTRTSCAEFNRVIAGLRPSGHGDRASGENGVRYAPGDAACAPSRVPLLRRIVWRTAAALNLLFSFPDKQIGWFFPLLRVVLREVRSGTRHVVSSSPPHSTHLAVALARCLRDFTWIADFRDPWTAPRRVRAGAIRLRIHRWLEAMVLRRADVVLANTPGNRAVLLQEFACLRPDKVRVVTNGFDAERFVDVVPADKWRDAISRADLVYIGSVYPGMLDTYLDSLTVLRNRGEVLPRVLVFGVFETEAERRKIEAAGMGDVVEFAGRVSYEESIQIMRAARALLLLLPRTERYARCVPSKLYPYLFSGRPVLAIVPDGDAAELLRTYGTGRVVTTADPGEASEEIQAFLRGDIRNPVDGSDLDRFTMRSLAGSLDTMLRSSRKGGG